MSLPSAIVIQKGGAAECRIVSQAAMLLDVPVARADVDELILLRDELRAGSMPVGSVEFVRQAMALAEVLEPQPMSYPVALDALLRRRIDRMQLDRVRGTCFVKPEATKLFTGFVWREGARDADYSEHDLEQLNSMRALSPSTMVWACEPVVFQCEWRFYVLDGSLLGSARYDQDGADAAPEPDLAVVHGAILAMRQDEQAPAAYALDFGVLADGQTALVEANDGWAIGYYSRSMAPKDYLRFLNARWDQLRLMAPESESKATDDRRNRP